MKSSVLSNLFFLSPSRNLNLISFFGILFLGSGYAQSLRPYSANPFYWEYNGQPILLLGGTDNDNLFQTSELEEHLDLLLSVGGNYVRNTMSSRDEGDFWPFKQSDNGQYDLNEWNDLYWQRFENFLKQTNERGIFVQIEIWDKWDMAPGRWKDNPWYPDNNINYSFQDTKLKAAYKEFHLEAHDFFNAVPLNKAEQIKKSEKTLQNSF